MNILSPLQLINSGLMTTGAEGDPPPLRRGDGRGGRGGAGGDHPRGQPPRDCAWQGVSR